MLAFQSAAWADDWAYAEIYSGPNTNTNLGALDLTTGVYTQIGQIGLSSTGGLGVYAGTLYTGGINSLTAVRL